ncbi:hypothetical protein NA56DRAFT_131013 [Hyaloscypha hepaticicola]|uniref:Uncharacterized protein n=1 Tax=Hyaloscypha hepaticicola TaxID=2082293 RepID=A0A2J6Q4C8_9HELO|nr:hypothetical protein NA56DRAFT_131013 [Hyaloscypha hepaticicola]
MGSPLDPLRALESDGPTNVIVQDDKTGRWMPVTPLLDTETGKAFVTQDMIAEALKSLQSLSTASGKDIEFASSSCAEEGHKSKNEIDELDYYSPDGPVTEADATKPEDLLRKITIPAWETNPNTSKVTTTRGEIEFLTVEEKDIVGRPDSVQVPKQWAGILLESLPCSAPEKHDDLAHVALTTAVPHPFTELWTSKEGKTIIKKLMWHLSTKTIRIYTTEPGKSQFWARFHKSGQIVSAAAALALVLRLRSNDDCLFGYLVGHAPPSVICELAMHQGGGLITPQIVQLAVEAITRKLARPTKQSKRRLAEAGGDLVQWSFRRSGASNEERLEEDLGKVIQQTKLNIQKSADDVNASLTPAQKSIPMLEVIKKTAIIHSLLVSGMFKYVLWLEQKEKKDRERAKLAIDITFSIIGFAGHGVDKASSLLAVISDALIEHYWIDRSQGLRVAVQDVVTEEIYWPLASTKKLPWYSETEILKKEEIDEYKGYFELVLRSNHL